MYALRNGFGGNGRSTSINASNTELLILWRWGAFGAKERREVTDPDFQILLIM